MREYLLRGGFFMADDFHGTSSGEMFEQRIKQVFPDRPIVDIADNDAIFHTVYDLDDRYQIPGAGAPATGLQERTASARTGAASTTTKAASWSRFRITPIWATPGNGPTSPYPEKFSALAIRIGVNYIVYAMTH